MSFGENLRSLRKAKGLKQDELAKEFNVSAKTISHWEKGYSEPSITQLLALAKFFDITLDDLLDNP